MHQHHAPWHCAALAAVAALVLPPALPAAEVAEANPPTTEVEAEEPAENPELAAMKAELERLQLVQQLEEARLAAEVREAKAEQQRLNAQHELEQAQLRQELARIKAERERLEARAGLEQQQAAWELREVKVENEKRQLETARLQDELQRAQLANQRIALELEAANTRFQLAELERQEAQAGLRAEIAVLQARLEKVKQEQAVRAVVEADLDHPAEPFVDGVLRVSDRRIALNGPIISGTADFVTRRIHYFNNQSQAPIFLVIDSCPGGSIMQGYRILKAIEASEAPVHVVVKSFAASMAAIILTNAEFSYAYPNAVILHHQPSSWLGGNLAVQKEWVETLQEWARRAHTTTAERMGITLEELYERMYEESVTGDWEEFADVAQQLGWVKHLVTLVEEDGIRAQPTDEAPKPWYWFLAQAEGLDQETATRIRAEVLNQRITLPKPDPFDFYLIYNRDGRYVWPE